MQFQDIGEFRIVLTSQISKGRNSIIYNCYRQDNQGLYPLCAKISKIQGENQNHFYQKVQELEEIRKMGNPNLQQIEMISCSMAEGTIQLIIIMEKYEISLKNEMNRRFSKSEQLKLTEDLSSGLGALYRKKTSHGDIRPENIYIKKDQYNNVYKLAYCQTSRILQSIAYENQFFSIYMAPELFPVDDVSRRKFMNDSKYCSVGYSDIFSLGVILSQLIFQIPIIKEKYEQEEIRQFHDSLLNNQIKFPMQFISDKIHDLIIEMLKYLPSNRINFEKMCLCIEEIKRAECSQTQKIFPQFNQEQIRNKGTCLPKGYNIFGQNKQNPFQIQQGRIPNFNQNQQNNQFQPNPLQQINGSNQQKNNFQPYPQNIAQFQQQQQFKKPNLQAVNQAQQQANIPQIDHQQNPQQQQFFNQIPPNGQQTKFIPKVQPHNNQMNNVNFNQNTCQSIEKQKLCFQSIAKFLENIINQSYQLIDRLTFNKLESAMAYFQKDCVINNLEEKLNQLKECFPYQSSQLTEDIYIKFSYSLIFLSNPGELLFTQNIQEMRELLDKQSLKNQ